MNRALNGTVSIVLGLLMFGWFVYGLLNPPTMPSETYSMDWVLIFVKLVGAIALLIAGILTFVRK